MNLMLSSIMWNYRKNKLNTFIIVFGFGISFAIVIYILSYVYSEISYDRFIKDSDRIYRVYGKGVISGRPLDIVVTSPDFATLLTDEIPEIEETVRLYMLGSREITFRDSEIDNPTIIRSDNNFFSFFDFRLVAKKDNDPLSDPSQIVISESLAKKYFGNINSALDQCIKIKDRGQEKEYFVSAVFKDITDNFHINFQIVQSVYINKDFDPGTFQNEYIYTYIKTRTPINNRSELDLKLTKYQYFHAYDADVYEIKSLDELKTSDPYFFVLTEPLKQIHFSKHKFDVAINSDKTYVYGSVFLSLMVIIISFINYLNLSMAALSMRFKNFGVLKIFGALRRNIAFLFISESLFFFVIIFLTSIFIYSLIGEPFTRLTGFNINLSSERIVFILFISGIILLLMILISGSVSFFVIKKQPLQELINQTNQDKISRFLSSRNFFILVQFTLASFIILATLIVNKQIKYFGSVDKGFNSDNVIVLRNNSISYNSLPPFIEELKKNPSVIEVSTSSNQIGDDPGMDASYFNSISDENYFHTSGLTVNDGFAKVYGLQLVEGRFFDKNISSDINEVLVNETAAREFMMEGPILGNYIIQESTPEIKSKIVGIVKDFNFRSLYYPIEPLILKRGNLFANIAVKINDKNIQGAIDFIEEVYKRFSTNNDFNYIFLNERLNRNYNKEIQFRKIISLISFIAIFISCIGLFSISQLSVISKTKEIAIRKINGARLYDILSLLNRNFIKWVIFSVLIASPAAYYVMHKWLENFTYKTNLSWWIFGLAGLMALGIALLTVSWFSLRAAIKNPIEALRYE